MKKEMTLKSVIDFCEDAEALDADVWLDGGWGVDALLEKQTRLHGDLDIIVQQKDIEKIKSLLDSKGYKIVPRDDLSEIKFHMADEFGHEIDFTVIVFDKDGNGIYGPVENNEMNPADSFSGIGTIAGHKVKCVSPEYAVKFHVGYDLEDKDYKDVTALCEKFDLELPQEYKKK